MTPSPATRAGDMSLHVSQEKRLHILQGFFWLVTV